MTFGDLMWESSQFFASDGFACSRWFVILATFKHGTNQCPLSWHFLSFPEAGPGNSDSSQGDTPDSLQIVGGHYVAPYVQYTSHIENPSKVIHTNTMRTWIAYKGIFWTKRSHISELALKMIGKTCFFGDVHWEYLACIVPLQKDEKTWFHLERLRTMWFFNSKCRQLCLTRKELSIRNIL